jgi:hypothetical protein
VVVEGPGFELAVGEHAADAAVDRAERELCDQVADAAPTTTWMVSHATLSSHSQDSTRSGGTAGSDKPGRLVKTR